MNADFVGSLTDLGMTEREAKLYIALLQKPESKAGELYRLSGVPRSQTHHTLELMTTKNYCKKRREGRFNFYSAIKPGQVLEMLELNWKAEQEKRSSIAETTFGRLDSIYADHIKDDKQMDFIEIVQTPHRLHQRFIELLDSSTEEVFSFNKSPYTFASNKVNIKKMKEQTNVGVSAHRRGASIKTIVMYEEDIWPYLEEECKRLVISKEEEIRVAQKIPIKMSVFDRKVVLITITGIASNFEDGVYQMIIHDKDFASTCRELVKMYWDKAIPFLEWQEQKGMKRST